MPTTAELEIPVRSLIHAQSDLRRGGTGENDGTRSQWIRVAGSRHVDFEYSDSQYYITVIAGATWRFQKRGKGGGLERNPEEEGAHRSPLSPIIFNLAGTNDEKDRRDPGKRVVGCRNGCALHVDDINATIWDLEGAKDMEWLRVRRIVRQVAEQNGVPLAEAKYGDIAIKGRKRWRDMDRIKGLGVVFDSTLDFDVH
ncbi:hypothetical protein BDZ91DRAFT_796815 [Kalaharituber pfeilii]|nr:hypothetical protein BDZ91DRAFT_796815 [Kalaharituber pfeilii]